MRLRAHRWSRCCWLALAAATATAVMAAGDDRARIANQRQLLEAGFAADEAACRNRFVVTQCVDDVQARRRNALATLREEELRLAEAERRERAALRRQAMARKKDAVAAASAPDAATSRPAARAAPVLPPPLDPPGRTHMRDAGEAEAASRRAVAAQRLRDSASEERQRIALREAERARNPKRSAPLPTPADAGGSAPSR